MSRGRHSRSRAPWPFLGVVALVVVGGWMLLVSGSGGRNRNVKSEGAPTARATTTVALATPRTSSTSAPAAAPTTATTATTDPSRRATRARAGAVLRANPAIAFSPAAVSDLLGGGVDARAMAVLSVMADNITGMQVYAFAGTAPRRSVELSTADPGKAMVFLAAQQSPFNPAVVRTATGLRLTFPPDLTCRQRLNPEECP